MSALTKSEKMLRLQRIFREVLDLPALEISETFAPGDCAAWDSVATVQIVLAMEQEFGARISVQTVAEFKNVGDLARQLPE
jgi:acyl carrier protein